MLKTISRQAFYDRVWSIPMTRLAEELETTTGTLKPICERAGVPTPPSGHWTKKGFGKAIDQPPLPPPSEGLEDPLTLAKRERQARRPK